MDRFPYQQKHRNNINCDSSNQFHDNNVNNNNNTYCKNLLAEYVDNKINSGLLLLEDQLFLIFKQDDSKLLTQSSIHYFLR